MQYSKALDTATRSRRPSKGAKGAKRTEPADRGSALVLALLIVALLMTLVLEFDRSVRLEHRAAGNYRDATAAFYLAKAGLAEGRALLLADGLSSKPSDDLEEAWALPAETRLGRGVVRVSITDEERFFPINSLITKNTPNLTRIPQFQRLLRSLQIDDRLADAVMDWIDDNDDVRPDGAENSYYESLTPPYRAHNGPMDSLEELRLIRGVTDEIYGRLAPHLSAVQSAAPIKINLNTADPIVLASLDERMTIDLAEQIVAQRPFEQLADVPTELAPGLVKSSATVSSQIFTIEAEGIVNDISKVVTMRLQRSALDQQPLWVRTQS